MLGEGRSELQPCTGFPIPPTSRSACNSKRYRHARLLRLSKSTSHGTTRATSCKMHDLMALGRKLLDQICEIHRPTTVSPITSFESQACGHGSAEEFLPTEYHQQRVYTVRNAKSEVPHLHELVDVEYTFCRGRLVGRQGIALIGIYPGDDVVGRRRRHQVAAAVVDGAHGDLLEQVRIHLAELTQAISGSPDTVR